ncbi:acyltransferase family protein [Desulfobacter latus]|uniref:Acyltransferase n=1 Tax=Desulfobacter latus TaxID=2292 RepID=A0A850SUL4_9BACT|nr:acyltransferase [Desulfobacter latus]NWH03710.1 acyltransferase [Desulfobacter latus]
MNMNASVDKTNYDISNYLKGFAIIAVYINHFIVNYTELPLGGYANGFISLFFILSGYGIYLSLEKNFIKEYYFYFLIRFFKKRLIRIYPLFWIWCGLHGFSNGYLGFLALDFIYPKSPWFIPAILQCYLISPLLFVSIKKMSFKKSLIICTLVFLILNTVLFKFAGEPFRTVGYRGLFFQHIFIFCLGCILAKHKSFNKISIFFPIMCIIFYFLCIQETTPQPWLLFPGRKYIVPFLFPFSVFLICYSLFSNSIYLPFNPIFQLIGRYSYAIYLFHGMGFTLMFKACLINRPIDSVTQAFTVIILSPILIYFYCSFELIISELTVGKRNFRDLFQNIKTLSGTYVKSFIKSLAIIEK